MRIEHVLIHNFRGVIHQEFTLNPYTLLIGGNNAGKSTIIDALRAFYEKDKYSFQESSDFPQKGAQDKERRLLWLSQKIRQYAICTQEGMWKPYLPHVFGMRVLCVQTIDYCAGIG